MSLTCKVRLAALAAAAIIWHPSLSAAQEIPPPAEPAGVAEEALAPAADAAAPMDAGENIRPLTKSDVDSWLDGLMSYALDQGSIVGAVVTVVKDGEILISKGYGYADLETKTPVDPARTLFRPGSVSKLFTWTAVMQLVEQGKLDLDEDINAYLDFKIPDAFGAPITLRHTLTHTPGFQEIVKRLIVKDPDDFLTLEDYLKSAIPSRVYPPGTTPAYSNYATALAGYVVERVSGESFDDYIDNHIFAPLNMNHSTFRQPLPEELAPLMSSGYTNAADGEAQYFELVSPAPAGSMSSTGDDMGRFMIAFLDENGPLLKPSTQRQMLTTYDQHTPPLNAMALGFFQQDQYNLSSVGHAGDTVFFHSDLHLYLDRGVGLYLSVNSGGRSGAAGAVRTLLAEKFADRYFPEAAAVEEEQLETAREHGEMVVGLYESSRSMWTNFLALTRYLGQVKVTMNKDGELTLPGGGGASRWREVAPFVWRKTDSPDRLSVSLVDGKVDHLAFEFISPFTVMLPVPWHRSSAIFTPLFLIGFAALVLTVFLWPVRAIVRWRYKTSFPLSGSSAMAYRLARIAALAVLAYLAGWMLFLTTSLSNLVSLSPAADANLRVLQFAQFVVYAALAIAVWNMSVVWKDRRSWLAMIWSAVLPASIAVVIWVAAICGLLSFNLNF